MFLKPDRPGFGRIYPGIFNELRPTGFAIPSLLIRICNPRIFKEAVEIL